MTKLNLFALVAAAAVVSSCSHKVDQTASYNVIPLPHQVTEGSGESFVLDGSTTIAYPAGNEGLKNDAEHLASYIKQLTGHELTVTDKAPGENVILLRDELGGDNPEGYVLTVNSGSIDINGASDAGTFYGIQTLRKSIPEAKESDVAFPPVTITDEPRFFLPWRPLRCFASFLPCRFSKELHRHDGSPQHQYSPLASDRRPGWRIEIKSRPLLTELGSKRDGTVIGHNSGKYDGIPVEGFYTQEEAREIVKYAADRHITVIPEIDLPGHMLGALKAYPELGCTGGSYEVWQQWGVSDDVLCAGNDSTYKFLDDVFTEILDIFPSEYIHVGGDECPKTRWESCPKCQAKIRELGLKADSHGTKEEKLQSHCDPPCQRFPHQQGPQDDRLG